MFVINFSFKKLGMFIFGIGYYHSSEKCLMLKYSIDLLLLPYFWNMTYVTTFKSKKVSRNVTAAVLNKEYRGS